MRGEKERREEGRRRGRKKKRKGVEQNQGQRMVKECQQTWHFLHTIKELHSG